MKQIRATPFRISRHEFYRAIRSMKGAMSPEEIFVSITDRKKEKMATFSKQLVAIVVVFLISSTTKSDLYVKIETSFANIDIPKLYVIFFLSVLLGAVSLELIGFFILNEYQRLISNKLLNFDNATFRSAVYDSSSPWSFPLNIYYRFFESSAYHKIFSVITVIFLMSPIAIIYFAAYSHCIGFIYKYFIGYSYLEYGDAICLVSFIFLLYPLFIVFFMFHPTNIIKNTKFIRWIFLTGIYKKTGAWPL